MKGAGSSGEKTRLFATRDSSTFKLSDDTHILRATSSDSNKKPLGHGPPKHQRNWTGLSGGDTTTISAEGRDNAQKGKRMRRNRYLSIKILIGLCYVFVSCYTCIILIGPLLLSFQKESDWCPVYQREDRNLKSSAVFNWDIPIEDREYNNPDFIQDPCRYARVPQLVWLTLEECDMSRRMLTSVILGGAIG